MIDDASEDVRTICWKAGTQLFEPSGAKEDSAVGGVPVVLVVPSAEIVRLRFSRFSIDDDSE